MKSDKFLNISFYVLMLAACVLFFTDFAPWAKISWLISPVIIYRAMAERAKYFKQCADEYEAAYKELYEKYEAANE